MSRSPSGEHFGGYFDPQDKSIVLNAEVHPEWHTPFALHELQHAIQQIEGWEGGANPDVMSNKMLDRDIAKQSINRVLADLEYAKRTDPPLYNQWVAHYEPYLKEKNDVLEQTKKLEGLTPNDAYMRSAIEEEARMIEKRRHYPEEKLAERPPYLDYESDPSLHITEFGMAKGGILGALAKTAEKGMEKAVKAAKVDIPPMGINVRTDSKLNIPFADLIVDGQKVYESRKSDSLRPYVNKSMSIVRTGKGPAKAIGSVEIGEPMIVDAKTFREMQDKHLVPEGSMFDIEAEGQKYLYPLSNSRRFDQELDVGHGIKARKVILPDDMDKKKGGRVTIDEFLKRMKER
jgi:predicted transcriptional regulator